MVRKKIHYCSKVFGQMFFFFLVVFCSPRLHLFDKKFAKALLQSSVSDDPSQIIQETFIVIINRQTDRNIDIR